MAWHRTLVARRWDYSDRRRPGRPPTRPAIKKLVLRLARENSQWGHRRIRGELARLGHPIAASTVWEILHVGGIDPAPRHSGPTWREFLSAQASRLIACDVLSIDTTGLQRPYSLVFLEHRTRRLHITGVTAHPTAPGLLSKRATSPPTSARVWTRCVSAPETANSKYTDDIEIIKTPARAPRANVHCERAIGSLHREVLDHSPHHR
ncbi:hypothetical protein [Saccharopolyspora pogona]|uniref:hypothetical protein n=1 Tax=Saccharopolyspora pogona TaxID=333966 RepID=UPI001CC25E2C|nr:hypothetical protein [Saccharopolyspora pogona]